MSSWSHAGRIRTPEAEKIRDMVEKGQTIEEIIQNHPELISGLDEYIRWRVEEAAIKEDINMISEVRHGLARSEIKNKQNNT